MTWSQEHPPHLKYGGGHQFQSQFSELFADLLSTVKRCESSVHGPPSITTI